MAQPTKANPTLHNKQRGLWTVYATRRQGISRAVPHGQGVEVRADKLRCKGLPDWSDKPVRQVGHADDTFVKKPNIPSVNGIR